jgi:hypothetical protein
LGRPGYHQSHGKNNNPQCIGHLLPQIYNSLRTILVSTYLFSLPTDTTREAINRIFAILQRNYSNQLNAQNSVLIFVATYLDITKRDGILKCQQVESVTSWAGVRISLTLASGFGITALSPASTFRPIWILIGAFIMIFNLCAIQAIAARFPCVRILYNCCESAVVHACYSQRVANLRRHPLIGSFESNRLCAPTRLPVAWQVRWQRRRRRRDYPTHSPCLCGASAVVDKDHMGSIRWRHCSPGAHRHFRKCRILRPL